MLYSSQTNKRSSSKSDTYTLSTQQERQLKKGLYVPSTQNKGGSGSAHKTREAFAEEDLVCVCVRRVGRAE